MSYTTKENIDRTKDLMRHRNPTGDLATILDASLALLLAQLEKERLGKTPRPRRRKPVEATNARVSSVLARAEIAARAPTASALVEAMMGPAVPVRSETTVHVTHALTRVETTTGDPAVPVRSETTAQAPYAHADAPSGSQGVSAPGSADGEPNTAEQAASTPATKTVRAGSRHVPTELRREVFARDGEQCTYVGPDGDRCPARGYVELDHIRPKALGGTEAEANLRVRCRAHNALYAEQVFGRAYVEGRRHSRHGKCAPPTPASFETAARGLRSMGFREPEARRALETLATRPEIEAATIETVLREALLVLS